MKTKNLFILLAVAGTIVFASCKKDETPAPLTKDEATTALTAINTGFSDLNAEYSSSEAANLQDEFWNLDLPFSGAPIKSPSTSKSFKSNYLKIIKPELAKNFGGDGPFIDFDFESNVGTHTYNGSTWSYSATPNNAIVIVFPYQSGTATLTYYEYQTKEYDSSPYLSHLKFKAELSGHTTPVYSWEYNANMGYTTASLSFTYTLGIYSQTEAISFSVSVGSSYKFRVSFDFIFKKNNTVIFAENADVLMTESNSGSSTEMDINITILNIVVKYHFYVDDNNRNSDNPADIMTISVWTTDGAKVADVIFKLEDYQYVAYFKYSDGSEEKVSDKLGDENDEGSLAYILHNITNELEDLLMFGFKK